MSWFARRNWLWQGTDGISISIEGSRLHIGPQEVPLVAFSWVAKWRGEALNAMREVVEASLVSRSAKVRVVFSETRFHLMHGLP